MLAAAIGRPHLRVADLGWPTVLPEDVPVLRTRGVAPDLLDAAADRLIAAGRPAGGR